MGPGSDDSASRDDRCHSTSSPGGLWPEIKRAGFWFWEAKDIQVERRPGPSLSQGSHVQTAGLSRGLDRWGRGPGLEPAFWQDTGTPGPSLQNEPPKEG